MERQKQETEARRVADVAEAAEQARLPMERGKRPDTDMDIGTLLRKERGWGLVRASCGDGTGTVGYWFGAHSAPEYDSWDVGDSVCFELEEVRAPLYAFSEATRSMMCERAESRQDEKAQASARGCPSRERSGASKCPGRCPSDA